MKHVYRIIDRFLIKERGYVYTISSKSHAKLGDILFDLFGHKFKLIGIEMLVGGVRTENDGLLLEAVDGVDVQGNLLMDSDDTANFLFCNHPLYPKQVDEDYEKEYKEACIDHECALFSYEDLEKGKLSLYGKEISGLTIYRGWMMKPEMYRTFYQLLEEQGIVLINTPEEYERYHLLPGWYDDFSDITAESVWTDSADWTDLLKSPLSGAYIVKDYVKSRKHEWHDACFIPDIEKAEDSRRVIGNFVNRQAESLVGGVVLRKFLPLKSIGFHEKSGMPISEEYRVFIFGGKVLISEKYWETELECNLSEAEVAWIEDITTRVKSNFATMDIARLENGKLIVMELGDGQVSGLQQISEYDFFRALEHGTSIRLGDCELPEGAVIMSSAGVTKMTAEEMQEYVSTIETTQDLVDAFVMAHNKYFFISDEIYDYDEGTDEYQRTLARVDAWDNIYTELDQRVMKAAEEEKLLKPRQPDSGTIKQMEDFMAKYGYYDGRGWWVKM